MEIAEELDRTGLLPPSFQTCAVGSWAADVWDNVTRVKTLNSRQTQRNLENHICPLQIDIVERLINRYSNPGDTVYDPFAGFMPYAMLYRREDGEIDPAWRRFQREWLRPEILGVKMAGIRNVASPPITAD